MSPHWRTSVLGGGRRGETLRQWKIHFFHERHKRVFVYPMWVMGRCASTGLLTVERKLPEHECSDVGAPAKFASYVCRQSWQEGLKKSIERKERPSKWDEAVPGTGRLWVQSLVEKVPVRSGFRYGTSAGMHNGSAQSRWRCTGKVEWVKRTWVTRSRERARKTE